MTNRAFHLKWLGLATLAFVHVGAAEAQCPVTEVYVPSPPYEGCNPSGVIYYYLCDATDSFYQSFVGGGPVATCGPPHDGDPVPSVPDCSCSLELCDGADSNGDGSTDEGCGNDESCVNYRTDPVHVGSGAFVTEGLVDIRYQGSDVPLEFVRHHSSLMAWPANAYGTQVTERTRLAPGWTTTIDERLFQTGWPQPTTSPTLGVAPLVIVHRQANGVGRRFSCPSPHSPAADFSCTTTDGSLDRLWWLASTSQWRVSSSRARVLTFFDTSGRLMRKSNASGSERWDVTYDPTSGRPTSVQDHLNRVLRLEWTAGVTPGTTRLYRIWDALIGGNVLATYPFTGSREGVMA